MNIEIRDIPNGSIIKKIHIDIEFEDGVVSSSDISQQILETQKPQKENFLESDKQKENSPKNDISDRKPKAVPNEMKHLEI